MKKAGQELLIGRPTNRWRQRLFFVVPVALLVGGLYFLSLVLSPKLIPYLNSGDVREAIGSTLPQKGNDRIYIQKLGVSVPFRAGDASVMKDGAWHRFPELGDPVMGGNFILSAHRWHSGKTPAETIAQSPFYNMDRMAVGDSVVIDFEGQRYKYEIYKIYQVKPEQTEIEAPIAAGEEPRMTLYTCTLKGSADGRVVLLARLVKV